MQCGLIKHATPTRVSRRLFARTTEKRCRISCTLDARRRTAQTPSSSYCEPSFLGNRFRRRGLFRTFAVPTPSSSNDGPLPGTRVEGANDEAPPTLQAINSQNGVSNEAAASSNGVNPTPKPRAVVAKGLPQRWRITFMMAVAFVLCNMDKVNMSVAVIPMAHELGWTATERGLVSSSFFWGYSLTQIPAGWISTKIGGAKVLLVGVALWSFGTLIAPPAAQVSILALCATRVLVGLGEGFAPSAATNVMARQVPQRERARAVTTVFGGLDVGSAVGLLLCGPLIRNYGWPVVFYLFAVLGAIWCCFWPMFKPEVQDRVMRAEERALAKEAASKNGAQSAEPSNQSMTAEQQKAQEDEEDRADAAQRLKEKVPWGAFFSSAPVWAIITAHFCYNWGYYTLLAWLPSYFELALGLNVEKSSYLTLIPYIAMTAMTPLVGPIADKMMDNGVSVTNVRKFCQNLAFLGPAVCMIACALLTPAAQTGGFGITVALVALLSLGFALGAWARGGLYCNHQDLSPKYASALLGITNTAGALPGVLGVTAAGYLLDCTNSWALALFYPTAICQIFGAIVYSIFASSERQSWS